MCFVVKYVVLKVHWGDFNYYLGKHLSMTQGLVIMIDEPGTKQICEVLILIGLESYYGDFIYCLGEHVSIPIRWQC